MKLRIAPAEVLRWVSSGLGWHSTRNWKEGWTYSGESAGRSDRAGRLSEGVPEHGARSTGRSPPLKEKCQLQNVFCNRQRGDYRREEMSGLETTRFFAGTVDRGNSGSRRRGRWSQARHCSKSEAGNEFCPRGCSTINKMGWSVRCQTSRIPFVMLASFITVYSEYYVGTPHLS